MRAGARRGAAVLAAVGVLLLVPAGTVWAQGSTGDTSQLLPPAPATSIVVSAAPTAPVDPDRQPTAPARRDAPANAGGTRLTLHDGILALVVVAALLLLAAVVVPVRRLLRRDRTADRRDGAAHVPTCSFSLLVPVGEDEDLLERTLASVRVLDHPDVELLAVVGDDDARSGLAARAAAHRHPGSVRVLPVPGRVRPEQLWSLALDHARGDVVGVLVAGDRVHPDLLGEVDRRCSAGADLVQCAVLPGRGGTGWWRGPHQLAARARWGRRAPVQARHGVLAFTAGGAFVRREALRTPALVLGDLLVTDAARIEVLGVDVAPTRTVTTADLRAHLAEQGRETRRRLARLRGRTWDLAPDRDARREVRAATFRPVLRALLVPAVVLLVLLAVVLDAPVTVLAVAVLPAIAAVLAAVAVTVELGEQRGPVTTVRTAAALGAHEVLLAAVVLAALLPARLPRTGTPVRSRALARGWPAPPADTPVRVPPDLVRTVS